MGRDAFFYIQSVKNRYLYKCLSKKDNDFCVQIIADFAQKVGKTFGRIVDFIYFCHRKRTQIGVSVHLSPRDTLFSRPYKFP